MRISESEKYMKYALEEAHSALSAGEIPVGAVIEYEGRIIARAHNLVETHGSRAAHAEILAMESALKNRPNEKRLTGCTLYTTLEPCAMCAGAAVNYGVDKIVFGAYDPEFGCTGSVTDIPQILTHGRIWTVGGVLKDECEDILNAFFSKMRSNHE